MSWPLYAAVPRSSNATAVRRKASPSAVVPWKSKVGRATAWFPSAALIASTWARSTLPIWAAARAATPLRAPIRSASV